MKKLILAALIGVASFSSLTTKAQISLSINIGSQPAWGPTGYDHVDYYYLPDVDAYYYVPTGQYIYLDGGQWAWRTSLPSRYGNFDPYTSYKVVVNRPKPWLSHQRDMQSYSKFKNYHGRQGNIRDSKDARYNQARNNTGRSGGNQHMQPGRQQQHQQPAQQQHQQPGRQQQHQQPAQQHQQPGREQQHQQPAQQHQQAGGQQHQQPAQQHQQAGGQQQHQPGGQQHPQGNEHHEGEKH